MANEMIFNWYTRYCKYFKIFSHTFEGTCCKMGRYPLWSGGFPRNSADESGVICRCASLWSTYMFPVPFWFIGILFDLSVQLSASELHKGRKPGIRIQMSLCGSSYFDSQGPVDFIYQKGFILCLWLAHIVSASDGVPMQTALVCWRKTCGQNVCWFVIDVCGKKIYKITSTSFNHHDALRASRKASDGLREKKKRCVT